LERNPSNEIGYFKVMNIIAYTDGGYNNINKSNAYGSFKVFSEKEEILKRIEYNFIHSSNEAEYQTIIELLHFLKENYPEDIDVKIFADSKLMVNQITGLWKVRAENIKAFHETATGLFFSFDKISLDWVTRKIIVKQLGH
jgi:ribonuclease HI